MKLPRPNVSPTTRNRAIRVYATFAAIMWRLLPVFIFGLLFTQVAVMVDQHHYRTAPATDFLNYTDFTVTNARVGEDVYFKVCRDHQSNIRYTGNLNIYVITNPDQKNEQKVKVYGHNLAGTIDNDCENKVIRASDFKHDAGTYEMSFCVDFSVKYGYQKEICKTSNRYRIYPQPVDLESQITSLQQQLQSAQTELKATQGNVNAPTNDNLAAPGQNSSPATQSTPSAGNTAPTGGSSNGGQSGTGVVPPSCAINLLGAGFACGSDGILRL
jgi:hypothetical protein